MELHLGCFEHKAAWAGQRKGAYTQVTASDLSKISLNAFYIWTMACHNALNAFSGWPSPSGCSVMCELGYCNSTSNRVLNSRIQSRC
jgi:hypothetical protein